jgi:tRNA (mo5U34)-methyltransferase
MGVIYHQRSPLERLCDLGVAMKPGAQLVVESQVIPGTDSVALFPPGRYGKARNVFFVPTAECLSAWVSRAGFIDVEICSLELVTSEEQRSTEFAPFESLVDFLCPENLAKTIEGHPAPLRAIITARKR